MKRFSGIFLCVLVSISGFFPSKTFSAPLPPNYYLLTFQDLSVGERFTDTNQPYESLGHGRGVTIASTANGKPTVVAEKSAGRVLKNVGPGEIPDSSGDRLRIALNGFTSHEVSLDVGLDLWDGYSITAVLVAYHGTTQVDYDSVIFSGTTTVQHNLKVESTAGDINAIEVYYRYTKGGKYAVASELIDDLLIRVYTPPDADNDTIPDSDDNCRHTPNPDQADTDKDGVGNACDNCVNNANSGQQNSDQDIWGDACDNCPLDINEDQLDSDKDTIGDVCDNCPQKFNPNQGDKDQDGIGDACDAFHISISPEQPTNKDIVTITAESTAPEGTKTISIFVNRQMVQECHSDRCEYTGGPYLSGLVFYAEFVLLDDSVYVMDEHYTVYATLSDWDRDGIDNEDDNCLFAPNPSQEDEDWDGVGDACDNCRPIYEDEEYCTDVFNASCPCVEPYIFQECIYCCDSAFARYTANPRQEDRDLDGVGDRCDSCRFSDPDDEVNIYGCNDECYDSDEGADYYDDGTVYVGPFGPLYGSTSFDDYCSADAETVYEYTCSASGPHEVRTAFVCPLGEMCFEGRCVDDRDEDKVRDTRDNCPDTENPDQKDYDNDGEGDACDCDDTYMGENEDGADCGGICPAACPACIPIILNGDPDDKIDIVFIPDEDYRGNTASFLTDVMTLIWSGYFGADDFYLNRCKFNFYYYPEDGDYVPICERWDLPADYSSDCSFADSAAIVFTGGGRACSSSVFSTGSGGTRTVVHETGHKIFGLRDEYCCDGGYGPVPAHLPNIFHSRADCEALAAHPEDCNNNFCPEEDCSWPSNLACRTFASTNSLDPDNCVGTCSPNWCNWRSTGFRRCCVDGGDGWWKADTNTCYMGPAGGVKDFEPDCRLRILDILSDLPNCRSTGGFRTAAGVAPQSQKQSKAIILDLNIKVAELSLQNAKIVYNKAPSHLPEIGEFTAEVTDLSGKELFNMFIADPRELRLDEPVQGEPSILMGSDVDFFIVLPYLTDMRFAEIQNTTKPPIQVKIDLADAILGFCETDGIQDPECIDSDLDKDTVKDKDDNCPKVANLDQKDSDGDGVGDICQMESYDVDNDCDVDGEDVWAYVKAGTIEDMAQFAKHFGMICK